MEEFEREVLLFGQEGVQKLKNSKVAVFGLGGVGGYVAESLARAGVGELHLIDGDKISLSNINRQIYALHSTVGKYKVDVAKERIEDINPQCIVKTYKIFFLPQNNEIDFSKFDYVVDAIDTVAGKVEIICRSRQSHVPVISIMGAGNKVDATAFKVADIGDTSVCPLARAVRAQLKDKNISGVLAVYSQEKPLKVEVKRQENGKVTPASNSFVPPVAGLIAAGEVIKYLTGFSRQ